MLASCVRGNLTNIAVETSHSALRALMISLRQLRNTVTFHLAPVTHLARDPRNTALQEHVVVSEACRRRWTVDHGIQKAVRSGL